MFKRLFGRERNATLALVDALYGQIVAAARRPVLYADWQVPDTPLGRYEMISLHLFLLLHRLRGETGPIREVAQELTDRHFAELEYSIRELGIGDMGVPKRMKTLARMFYGRVKSYGDALDEADSAALVTAIARNVRPTETTWTQAADLAVYAERARRSLGDQPVSAFLGGVIAFPDPSRPVEAVS